MAMPHDATVIRCKLDELRVLDQAAAHAIEREWPLTLEHLDAPDDQVVALTTMAVNRRVLERELDDAIRAARAL